MVSVACSLSFIGGKTPTRPTTVSIGTHSEMAMMINGIVIGVGLYARAIPYTSPRLLPRK